MPAFSMHPEVKKAAEPAATPTEGGAHADLKRSIRGRDFGEQARALAPEGETKGGGAEATDADPLGVGERSRGGAAAKRPSAKAPVEDKKGAPDAKEDGAAARSMLQGALQDVLVAQATFKMAWGLADGSPDIARAIQGAISSAMLMTDELATKLSDALTNVDANLIRAARTWSLSPLTGWLRQIGQTSLELVTSPLSDGVLERWKAAGIEIPKVGVLGLYPQPLGSAFGLLGPKLDMFHDVVLRGYGQQQDKRVAGDAKSAPTPQ